MRPPRAPLLLLALVASLSGAATAAKCVRDSDCRSTQLLGMVKVDANRLVPDLRDGSCCGGSLSSDGCYWSKVQDCTDQADTSPQQKVCFKKGEEACGTDCCNKETHVCESYTETNGNVVYDCVLRMTPSIGFWIVALPLILTLLTALAMLGAVFHIRPYVKTFKKLQKAIVVLSFVAWLFGVPFYYSSAWTYGVAITATVCLGLVSLPSTTRAPQWLSVLFHIALFTAMLGWATGNTWWSSWATGILSPEAIYCSPRYGNFFDRSGLTSGKWASPEAAYRAERDGHIVGRSWGYCSVHWWVALWVFGALGIVLSAVLLVAHVLLLSEDKPKPAMPLVIPTQSVGIMPA